MNSKNPPLNDDIRNIVRTLAPAAASDQDLSRLLFDVLCAANQDPHQVSLEAAKQLLLEARRARRQASAAPELAVTVD